MTDKVPMETARIRPSWRMALLGVAVGLAFPGMAEAVLFPAIADKFEAAPVYSGCPALGSGAAQAQPALCAELKRPEDYCSPFHLVKSLENDPAIPGPYRACLAFYKAAVDSQQLICDYQKDAQQLQQALTANASTVSGAASAEGAGVTNLRCAQKVYGYYRQAALQQASVLDKAYGPSKDLLYKLADVGTAHLKLEVSCSQDGVPGAAPGYLLIGLSAHAMSDQKATRENLLGSLTRFSIAMFNQFGAADSKRDQIATRESNLGAIGTARGVAVKRNTSDITSSGTPDEEEPNYAATGGTDLVKGTALKAAQKTLLQEANFTVGSFVQDMMLPAGSVALEAAGKAGARGMVVGLGITYLANGKVSQVDVAEAVVTTGVGVVGGVVGAPALLSLGAAVGAGLIIEKLRHMYNAYDVEVARPYEKFARAKVRAMGASTSEQVAQAYRSQKLQFAYCSKCNVREAQSGCPGYSGYIHGLNPNYLSDDGNLFSNPWMNRAYQQYRATYPQGSNIPFSGPNVAPTAVFPGTTAAP